MEIRIHPFVIELCTLWRSVCENVRELVSKGVTWTECGPNIEKAANAVLRPDRVDMFLRLCELAFRKYEKELTQ